MGNEQERARASKSQSKGKSQEVSEWESERPYITHLCQDIKAEHAACLQSSAFVAAVCAQ